MKKRILFIILSLALVMLESSFAEDSGQPKSIFEQYLEARKGFLPKNFFSSYDGTVQTDFLINDLTHYICGLELSVLKVDRPYILDDFSAVVGDSRSLHRGRVTFEDPRIIVAIPLINLTRLNFLEGIFPGIILAYSPVAKQLEVMSWVPQTGTYAFHVIDNYESNLKNGYLVSEDEQKKRVEVFPTMPKRESCLSCHQHGGPVFSHSPWAETPSRDDITQLKMKKFIQYSGMGNGNSYEMDIIIRTAAKHIQVNRIAREICENNVACRRFLLGLALIGNHPGMNESIRQKLNQQFFDLIKDRWPHDGFGYPSSVLPDRHFRSEKIKNGITPLYLITDKIELIHSLIDNNFFKDTKNLWSYVNSYPEFTIEELIRVARHEKDREILIEISNAKFLNYIEALALGGERTFLKLAGIKQIPIQGYLEDLSPGTENLTPADPRYLRQPLVGEILPQYAADRIMKHLYSVFGFNQEIMQELTTALSFDILYEVAFENTEWMTDLVTSPVWPPAGNAVRKTIKDVLSNVLRVKKADQDLEKLGFKHYIDPSKIQEEEKGDVIPKETPDSKKFSDDNATKILKSYCSSCHGGQNPKSGIELPLDDPQALRKYRDDTGQSVVDHLEGTAESMPPIDSKPLSEEERKTLIEWLRKIQQPDKKE